MITLRYSEYLMKNLKELEKRLIEKDGKDGKDGEVNGFEKHKNGIV
jgi:hypothetical protein